MSTLQAPTSIDDIEVEENINVVEGPTTDGSTTNMYAHVKGHGRGDGRPPVARSWVWNHFTKQEIEGEQKAMCNYCGAKLVGHSKHGTKHLIRHHESCKRRLYEEAGQQKLSFGKKVGNAREVVNVQTFNKLTCKEKVVKLVVMHELPLSFVEYDAFRELMYYAQPLFPSMSRGTLKNEILRIFGVQKNKTKELIESSGGRIAITSDMWTASNQKRGYMVITSHFIDCNYVLHSRLLRFIYVPCPHTAEALSKELIACFVEWKLDRRLSTITLDNCSTNDAMIPYLKRSLKVEHMMLGGKLFHMRCTAHILNIIVKEGLEVLGDGIDRIRESVAFWSSTPKRYEKFQNVVAELNLSCTKKLMLDCRTRWNSTYLMLTTALEYREVFERLAIFDRDYSSPPLDAQWELAEEICGHLKVFYKLTNLFSGTRYPTANLWFPMVCDLRLELGRWLSLSNAKIRAMAKDMIKKFEKYWEILHGMLAVAVVLDPRHKMILIRFFFRKIYGHEADCYVGKVRSLLEEFVDQYKLPRTNPSYGLDGLQQMPEDNRSVGSKSKRVESTESIDFLSSDEYKEYKSQETQLQSKSELDLYLEEPTFSESNEVFNILVWWKANSAKYPVLAAFAKDILAVPVTTVASESAFSAGGHYLSPHRSRLTPNTLEALMCTQNWLWASSHGLTLESQLLNGEEAMYEYEYDEDMEAEAGLGPSSTGSTSFP